MDSKERLKSQKLNYRQQVKQVKSNEPIQENEHKPVINSTFNDPFFTVDLISSKVNIPNYPKSLSLTYLKVKDEKAIANATNQLEYIRVLRNIIQAKVIEDFNIDNLIIFDFEALLIWIRVKSVGITYDLAYKCVHCGKVNEAVAYLNKLDIVELNDKYKEPYEVYVKETDTKFNLRLPRLGEYIELLAKEYDEDIYLPALTLEGSFEEKIERFENLTPIEQAYLETFIKVFSFGIIPAYKTKCSNCEGVNNVLIPFREPSFFTTENLHKDDIEKAILG